MEEKEWMGGWDIKAGRTQTRKETRSERISARRIEDSWVAGGAGIVAVAFDSSWAMFRRLQLAVGHLWVDVGCGAGDACERALPTSDGDPVARARVQLQNSVNCRTGGIWTSIYLLGNSLHR
jgi:hypothetical protein